MYPLFVRRFQRKRDFIGMITILLPAGPTNSLFIVVTRAYCRSSRLQQACSINTYLPRVRPVGALPRREGLQALDEEPRRCPPRAEKEQAANASLVSQGVPGIQGLVSD